MEKAFEKGFLLKGSTYTDTIYGALGNRSGMIIAGAALLGGTGLYFELFTIPDIYILLFRILFSQRDKRSA